MTQKKSRSTQPLMSTSVLMALGVVTAVVGSGLAATRLSMFSGDMTKVLGVSTGVSGSQIAPQPTSIPISGSSLSRSTSYVNVSFSSITGKLAGAGIVSPKFTKATSFMQPLGNGTLAAYFQSELADVNGATYTMQLTFNIDEKSSTWYMKSGYIESIGKYPARFDFPGFLSGELSNPGATKSIVTFSFDNNSISFVAPIMTLRSSVAAPSPVPSPSVMPKPSPVPSPSVMPKPSPTPNPVLKTTTTTTDRK